ncbi:IS3 family transposase, partial [Gilliamella sp. Fer4-1]|uniref:IS3 family transposase n=1 Tax=Gilliamella sp. Fer4-1 TaxID=3120242 RepID=UPI003FA5E43B
MKTIKTGFVKDQRFNYIIELQHASPSYAYWYNNKRWHSSLGYLLLLNLKNTYPFNFL